MAPNRIPPAMVSPAPMIEETRKIDRVIPDVVSHPRISTERLLRPNERDIQAHATGRQARTDAPWVLPRNPGVDSSPFLLAGSVDRRALETLLAPTPAMGTEVAVIPDQDHRGTIPRRDPAKAMVHGEAIVHGEAMVHAKIMAPGEAHRLHLIVARTAEKEATPPAVTDPAAGNGPADSSPKGHRPDLECCGSPGVIGLTSSVLVHQGSSGIGLV